MKRILFLISFIAPFLFAQQNSNGSISMVFNNEKIDLPISTISIHKNNGTILSFKAEIEDSIIQQMVKLELGFNELSSKLDAETLDGTKIDISTRNNKTNSGKYLSMWFDGPSGDDNDYFEAAHYGVFNKGEKISWGINSVSLKINITDVQYIDGALHINGELKGTFKSTSAPEGQVAEIKDCKFEVII
ncbi:MAG TPA: hypothetical protein VK870_16930 [Ignavibacteriaceae bacterium]|nr:hypothetical protein [Ignavibacteriaceae bacterium]